MVYKAIILFLLSTFKYAMTIPPIVFYFNYLDSLLISIGGGLFGIVFFRFVWIWILTFWNKYVIKKEWAEPGPVKLNKRKRYIVRMKNKYGYWGIIILTPIFLSIPLGVFLLQRYFRFHKHKFVVLSISLIIWGTIIVSFFSIIPFDNINNYLGL
jgi:hypothetical protein